jgi:hypothetical protein
MARALRFASIDTADEYLALLQSHVDVFIGETEPAGKLPLPGAPTLHRQLLCGCSPKEIPSHVAAWRRDEIVLMLIVTGPEDGLAAMSLSRRLDAFAETEEQG